MAAFNASQGVFNDNPSGGEYTIAEKVRDFQVTTFGLFLGLPGQDVGGFVPLKASIFAQCRVARIDNDRLIRLFLVVFLASLSRGQISDLTAVDVHPDQGFIRVPFFCHYSVLSSLWRSGDVADAVRSHP